MTNNAKNRDDRTLVRMAVSAAAVSAMLALTACASGDEAAAEAADTTVAADASSQPAPAPTTFGAAASPRFKVPSAADQSPPSVNSVPTTAPTPRSTEEEREAARKGLIADLANARHSDLGGRTQPVVVRPYVAAAQPAATTPEPEPASAPDASRLDAPPPPRPAEADGAPAKPAAGPAPANKIPTGS